MMKLLKTNYDLS